MWQYCNLPRDTDCLTGTAGSPGAEEGKSLCWTGEWGRLLHHCLMAWLLTPFCASCGCTMTRETTTAAVAWVTGELGAAARSDAQHFPDVFTPSGKNGKVPVYVSENLAHWTAGKLVWGWMESARRAQILDCDRCADVRSNEVSFGAKITFSQQKFSLFIQDFETRKKNLGPF